MFKFIMEWFKNRNIVKTILKDEPTRIALSVLYQVFNDKSQGLGKYAANPTLKEPIVRSIVEELTKIKSSDNPALVNREFLSFYTFFLAEYGVLLFPKIQPFENFGGSCEPSVISGDLVRHLNEISEKSQLFKNYTWNAQSSSQDRNKEAFDICLFNFWTVELHLKVSNALRLHFGDYNSDPQKDWFRPFIRAMCIWREDCYRSELGLPPLVTEMEALKYSVFYDLVKNGEKDPFEEWKNDFDENTTARINKN